MENYDMQNEEVSELNAVLWHFLAIKIPTQGTKSIACHIQTSKNKCCRLRP